MEVFLENLPVIREIIAHCARRFSPQDGEDFSQTVMTRLIEEDYRVLPTIRRTVCAVSHRRFALGPTKTSNQDPGEPERSGKFSAVSV